MAALTDLTIAEARASLRQKKISAREITQAHLDAIAGAKALNAFITETPERALDMAAQSDARLARGEARALDGIPLAIKDLRSIFPSLKAKSIFTESKIVLSSEKILSRILEKRSSVARRFTLAFS